MYHNALTKSNFQLHRSSPTFYRYKCVVYFLYMSQNVERNLSLLPCQQNGKYSIMHKAENGTLQAETLFSVRGMPNDVNLHLHAKKLIKQDNIIYKQTAWNVDILQTTSTSIGHVRHINVVTQLRGFLDNFVNFLGFVLLSLPKRDLDTKKTTPHKEVNLLS